MHIDIQYSIYCNPSEAYKKLKYFYTVKYNTS